MLYDKIRVRWHDIMQSTHVTKDRICCYIMYYNFHCPVYRLLYVNRTAWITNDIHFFLTFSNSLLMKTGNCSSEEFQLFAKFNICFIGAKLFESCLVPAKKKNLHIL